MNNGEIYEAIKKPVKLNEFTLYSNVPWKADHLASWEEQ